VSGLSPQVAALVLALGLALSLGCYVVSRLSPGGMITPGWLALAVVESPRLGLVLIGVVAVTYAAARGVMAATILYGKRLFASVLLLGVFCSTTASLFLADVLPELTAAGTLGFVAPGLVAYQLIRQPLGPTLLATSTVTAVTYAIVLGGVLTGVVPTDAVPASADIDILLPTETSARLLLVTGVAGALLVLLAASRRSVRSWAGFATLQPAFAAAGPAAADSRPVPSEHTDAAALARRAAALAGDEWDRFLVHLRDHAERSERRLFETLPEPAGDEPAPCRCG
jgi:gamma-polyglutamate biosynthesis protein CapC